jgi:phage terminase large subunit GpA-like protein
MYAKNLAKNLGGHWVGTDACKDLIYTRARLEPLKAEPDETSNRQSGSDFPDGFMHFPQRFDEDFIKQFFAEKVSVRYEGSREIRTYQNKSGVRNEALDLMVYNLAAYRLLRLSEARLSVIEADLKQAAEAAKLKHGENQPGLRTGPAGDGKKLLRKGRRVRSEWLNWNR